MEKPKSRKVTVTYDEYLSILEAYSLLESNGKNKVHLKNIKKLIEKIIGA